VIAPGGDDATATAHANNARRSHEPGNPFLSDCPAFGTQLRVHARRSMRAAGGTMDRAHLIQTDRLLL
jgi:hypothetical protein